MQQLQKSRKGDREIEPLLYIPLQPSATQPNYAYLRVSSDVPVRKPHQDNAGWVLPATDVETQHINGSGGPITPLLHLITSSTHFVSKVMGTTTTAVAIGLRTYKNMHNNFHQLNKGLAHFKTVQWLRSQLARLYT